MLTVNLEAPYTRPSFPWQIFPWQVLFARVHSINWHWSFSLKRNLGSKAGHATFSTRKRCVRPARKTCPFKQMCEHRRQGKLVQPYTRANKTYQGELICRKKLVHCTHEQVKLTRNLSRKTWSCVRGFLRTFELAYNSQIFGVDIVRNFFSKTFTI